MSIYFGDENDTSWMTEPNPENPACPDGTHGMNCWLSTADVDKGLWIGIACAVPVAGVLGFLHRKEKFTCLGKYSPQGLEDRLTWLSTISLAIFFVVKMFVGADLKGGYLGQIWEKDPTIV